MSLIEFWDKSRDAVMRKTIQQIVAMAGDGVIKDDSLCATELRGFFQRVDRKDLERYARSCLEASFTDSGFVLQDIVNEVGRRLGFDVTRGIYRGKQKSNNFDGFWDIGDWSFLVEVKTTDVYSISLDKIAKYLQQSKAEQAGRDVSCLIVVGRKDTATLEDQLRGSRHNWDMRIIGVEALFRALELRELSEAPELSSRLVEILKPQEFTRVDQIVTMAFDFATDREDALKTLFMSGDEEGDVERVEAETSSAQGVTSDGGSIKELKTLIGERLAQKFGISLMRERSSFESGVDGYRFWVAASKLYEGPIWYWFAYHPRQSKFLNEVAHGYFVLGHLDTGRVFAIPVQQMDKMAAHMNMTIPNGDKSRRYHHVHSRSRNGREFLLTRGGSPEFDITEYEI